MLRSSPNNNDNKKSSQVFFHFFFISCELKGGFFTQFGIKELMDFEIHKHFYFKEPGVPRLTMKDTFFKRLVNHVTNTCTPYHSSTISYITCPYLNLDTLCARRHTRL
jgi:hypothetical protein